MFGFNPVEVFKQAIAAGAASFAASFPAAALATDLTAAKAAVLAAILAGFGVIAGFVGNLIKQIIERARGIVGEGYEDITALLDEAAKAIEAAKQAL